MGQISRDVSAGAHDPKTLDDTHTAPQQGRQRGPLPAAGPQCVGPGSEAVGGAGRVQLGREEPGTLEALQRLVDLVARHLKPGKAKAVAAEGLEFAESRPLGGTWVLDALWERLGIGPAMRGLLKGRRLDASAERVLLAALQYRLNVTFDLLAHESICSPGTDRIVDGGVTSFTRFSIVASEF
jgi:hypothetical protein